METASTISHTQNAEENGSPEGMDVKGVYRVAALEFSSFVSSARDY
ncbi:MAG: hypothetical protein R3A11_01575 [Bdellovibrionota bacterium]